MIDDGWVDSPDGAEQVVLGEGLVEWGEGWAAGDRLCVLGYSLC